MVRGVPMRFKDLQKGTLYKLDPIFVTGDYQYALIVSDLINDDILLGAY